MIHRIWLVLFLSLFLFGCKKKHQDTEPTQPPRVLSSDKAITSFTFRSVDNSIVSAIDVVGSIGSDTITVELNKGINLSNLIPTIGHSGITMVPATNIAQNFNNTIDYTVKAEDGSTKKYTIKIVLVTANQKVFVGSDDGNLYALNAHNGTLLWKYTTGGAIQSSPSLVNNTIYVGSMDKNLYAIDATTGLLKWKFLTTAPIRSESPVVADGNVIITSSNNYPDGHIYAVDAVSGMLKWSKYLPGASGPSASGGKVFIASIEGHYNAYNVSDGSIAWAKSYPFIRATTISNDKLYINGSIPERLFCVDINTGNHIWRVDCLSTGSKPTVRNGTVYLSCPTGIPQFSEAYDANDGTFKWKYSPIRAGATSQNPFCPVVSNGLAFSGFHYGVFYALNATTGAKAWEFGDATQSGLWFANPAVANRVIYTGSYDKYLYALEVATGKMLWRFLTAGNITSGPCGIDSDGAIFHAGSSGQAN